jgi:hypothetical protein
VAIDANGNCSSCEYEINHAPKMNLKIGRLELNLVYEASGAGLERVWATSSLSSLAKNIGLHVCIGNRCGFLWPGRCHGLS